MIKITLPDGAVREYPEGTNSLDIAKSISEGLARKVIAANVNGEVWDATRPIQEDASVKLLTWNDRGREIHFLAFYRPSDGRSRGIHFPGCKILGGPAVENGFYYDMDLGGRQITEEDLRKLEVKMTELAAKQNRIYPERSSKGRSHSFFSGKRR